MVGRLPDLGEVLQSLLGMEEEGLGEVSEDVVHLTTGQFLCQGLADVSGQTSHATPHLQHAHHALLGQGRLHGTWYQDMQIR